MGVKENVLVSVLELREGSKTVTLKRKKDRQCEIKTGL